ncbi:hypothetical protein N180_06915 [Pedobacter antarcticus 4BY]|uniref:Uncharacterized protein n=1 Tax=Pedobacter antarcticus 4BY TaxID=1358423 RepID=A0A081PEZ8_9SPHI|nr:hypothetical protein N180_06915 [Pedobacter antarcticus 4BY]
MTCIIFMSVLVGRSGSFFLKKYIKQMYKINEHSCRLSVGEAAFSAGSVKKKRALNQGPLFMLFKKD